MGLDLNNTAQNSIRGDPEEETLSGLLYYTLPTQGIRPCSLPAEEETAIEVMEARRPGRTLAPAPLSLAFFTEARSHILLRIRN